MFAILLIVLCQSANIIAPTVVVLGTTAAVVSDVPADGVSK